MWRSLGTGFLAGLLVAAFGGLQFYIWLRRRQTPPPTALPTRTAVAGAERSDGIMPGDPGHVAARRDHA